MAGAALSEWTGRFGVLGAKAGHIMPRENVLQSGMFKQPISNTSENDSPQAAEEKESRLFHILNSPMNYCGFLEGSSDTKLYTVPKAEGIACLSNVDVTCDVEVDHSDIVFQNASQNWSLRGHGNRMAGGQPLDFESLVLANSDPVYAANVIDNLLSSSVDCEMTQPQVAAVISEFTSKLRSLEDLRESRYTLMIALPQPLAHFSLDGASVHGSPEIQFISRENSKPGRNFPDGVECWVIQSTSNFAEALDLQGKDETVAAEILWKAFAELLQKTSPSDLLPQPLSLKAKRWERGFFKQPMNLNSPGEHHNDAVTFRPWKLALCGDYLGNRQRVEEAALSAMMAANRVAEWAHHG
eukprot:TRINITY_DN94713_c0_g1_i1.p1 TRINITY_DN94713_c0_g1~~TRINITY_DN94713_c0_g1_i1.p1  ORF type:complete len:394 (+),score=81.41 TRINITY_DN94713_c0_g1_i1:119-1183(+)